MAVKLLVDEFRKVTVSLGGRCSVGCRHCYTTARQFITVDAVQPAEVIEELSALAGLFSIVCISGDTDTFLDEAGGLLLLQLLAESFPAVDIEFTTRLIPDSGTIAAVAEVGAHMAERGRLLVPAVSFVSPHVPNVSESARTVPSVEARFSLLEQFTKLGLPCMMALRPTFPFSVVPADDVRWLLLAAKNRVAAVLGETFILDFGGSIARRLSMPAELDSDRESFMSFLAQRTLWRKRSHSAEALFARSICADLGIPYFMRSGSAMAYLREAWDFGLGKIRDGYPVELYMELDHLDP